MLFGKEKAANLLMEINHLRTDLSRFLYSENSGQHYF